nr:MAG TPA: hypothetical protein [Caudoviricetes sp.]
MAITYGMSVREFWDDNPDLFWAYRFSYVKKREFEQELFNNNAWLQGTYFYEAVSVALCNAFSKSRVEYSKKPYGLKDKVLSEEVKKERINKQVADMKARIMQSNAIRTGALKQEFIKGTIRV